MNDRQIAKLVCDEILNRHICEGALLPDDGSLIHAWNIAKQEGRA